MSRSLFVVLTLLALSAALFAGWWSNRRAVYFPVELQSRFNDCEVVPGDWNRKRVQDEFQAEWYAGELADLEEPSLYDRTQGAARSLRFTWLRSFHDPIAVRIDATPDGGLHMTARRNPTGDDMSSYAREPGLRRHSRLLTATEARDLEAILDQTRVLTAPSSGCMCCTDGAQWIVESSDPAHGYRFHSRQSPDSGPERQIGEFLLALTGWDVDPIY